MPVAGSRAAPVDHGDLPGVEEEVRGLEIAVADDRAGHLEQREEPLSVLESLRQARGRAVLDQVPSQAKAVSGESPAVPGHRPPGRGQAVQGGLARGQPASRRMRHGAAAAAAAIVVPASRCVTWTGNSSSSPGGTRSRTGGTG